MSFARAGALPESLKRGELLRDLPKRNTAPFVGQHSVSGVGAPSMSLGQQSNRAAVKTSPILRDAVTRHASCCRVERFADHYDASIPPSSSSDLEGFGRVTLMLGAEYLP